MKPIPDIYWHEIRTRFGRLPVWLPGTRFTLGDVGVLSPQRWVKRTRLADLGVVVKADRPGAPSDYDYASTGGVQIDIQLAGQADVVVPGMQAGAAGFRATFSRAGACVVKAGQVRLHRIGNLEEVEEAVLRLYADGIWKREWTYVTEVAIGSPSCVLVAESRSASAVVRLGVDMPTGAGAVASVRSRLRVDSHRDMAAAFATPDEATVLWSGRYVRDPRFRSAVTAERGEPAECLPGASDVGEEPPQTLPIVYPDDNLPDDAVDWVS